jgi:hypothetical protein
MTMRTPTPVKVAVAGLVSCLFLAASGVWAGASSSSALTEAKKHVLTVAAMPKGWKVEKGSTYSSGANSNFPGATQLATCIGVPKALITSSPPEEDSPYYQNKDGSLEVQDAVSVFPSARNAKAEYAAISSGKTPACYAALLNSASFKSQLAASAGTAVTVGTVTVKKAARLGKHVAGFTATIPITSQGQSVTIQKSQVFYVKGHLGHQLSFTSYSVPFPASVMAHVTAEAKQTL